MLTKDPVSKGHLDRSRRSGRENAWPIDAFRYLCYPRSQVNPRQVAGRARPATFPLEKKSQWSMVVVEGATPQGSAGCLRVHLTPCQAKGSSKGSRIPPAGRHATDGHEPRQVRKEAAISDAGCVVLRYRLPVFRGPFLGPLAQVNPPSAVSPISSVNA
jgi:hypothetical protein